METPAETPAYGRTVFVRIGGTDDEPVIRPGFVVQVWNSTCVNVQLQLDGTNDRRWTDSEGKPLFTEEQLSRGSAWLTSIVEGNAIREWRWPHKSRRS